MSEYYQDKYEIVITISFVDIEDEQNEVCMDSWTICPVEIKDVYSLRNNPIMLNHLIWTRVADWMLNHTLYKVLKIDIKEVIHE